MRRTIAAAALLVVTVALLLTVRHPRTSGIIPQVRAAIAVGNLSRGEAMLREYRRRHGNTPEALEALSWLARGALSRHDLDRADKYAGETYDAALAALKQRPLDRETHLPIALGAAIEVEAQAAAERGERSDAVAFLDDQLARFRTTSIGTRIEKNINLLTLEGKPVPQLTASEFLGPKMPDMRGRPVLLFFWAHWCPDCKAMAPIVAQVESEFRRDGLLVVGPTQRYGYVQSGTPASPADEFAHIEAVRRQYYGALADMPVPISQEDFLRFGVSTTPTLVLVNRDGMVTMYHPGRMTRAALEAMVNKTLAPAAGSVAAENHLAGSPGSR